MTDTAEATVQRIDPPDKLAILQDRILTINEDMSEDDVLAISEAIDSAYERIKELRAMRDEAMIGYLKEHGPIESGETLYVASKDKSVKCRDLGATAMAALEASGGDWDTFANMLSANAFKYGAFKGLAGQEKFDECFETIERDKVAFKKINTRFVKGGKS